ncbi:MAG TPA: metallophosphoesterase [Trichocoleus sp.]|jgi:3',5'-cyclic AMP phosphodiesterase CpdA
MTLHFRFAILSDPHIALPQTVWNTPNRFHLVEVSIPALESVFEHLAQLNLDFLLIPGDLTQHGEAENHAWLSDRLSRLPYPVYVVPGNHDVPQAASNAQSTGIAEFPTYYQKFGYRNPEQPYYTCHVLPGVRLIGLNSNAFDASGQQIGMGWLDAAQLDWLQQVLSETQDEVVLVMVHHNVIEHLPGQAKSSMGRRYMLENAAALLDLLHQANVRLIFTGHLHIQDIAEHQGIYEITTGSLVSYPHPYRVLEFHQDNEGQQQLQINSHRITSVADYPDLLQTSRQWMSDRSFPFMLKLLTQPPLNIPLEEAETLAPTLRHFWADIAHGDATFHFPEFSPELNQHFAKFGAIDAQGQFYPIDNNAILLLSPESLLRTFEGITMPIR